MINPNKFYLQIIFALNKICFNFICYANVGITKNKIILSVISFWYLPGDCSKSTPKKMSKLLPISRKDFPFLPTKMFIKFKNLHWQHYIILHFNNLFNLPTNSNLINSLLIWSRIRNMAVSITNKYTRIDISILHLIFD